MCPNRWVETHFLTGHQYFRYSSILVMHWSSQSVLFCFAGRHLQNVENHYLRWSKSVLWFLSFALYSSGQEENIRTLIVRFKSENEDLLDIRKVFLHPAFKFPSLYADLAVAEVGKVELHCCHLTWSLFSYCYYYNGKSMLNCCFSWRGFETTYIESNAN